MPNVDLFIWMIDILAKRYGWTAHYISEKLYWEEMYEHLKVAANFDAEERNSELKFQYMLHADEKGVSQWKDLPIPYPVSETKATLREVLDDSTGVKQIRTLAPHIPVHHLSEKVVNKEIFEKKANNNILK
jgi:hypothetical protein